MIGRACKTRSKTKLWFAVATFSAGLIVVFYRPWHPPSQQWPTEIHHYSSRNTSLVIAIATSGDNTTPKPLESNTINNGSLHHQEQEEDRIVDNKPVTLESPNWGAHGSTTYQEWDRVRNISSSRTVTKQGPKHNWRLYGAAKIDKSSGNHPKRGGVRLFNSETQSRNKQLLNSFQKVALSCSPRLEADRNTMSEKYGKFLEALSNYAEFHTRNRYRADMGKLVWYCDNMNTCGGLSDRIRGATYTLLIAMMTNRVLLFNWTDSKIINKTYLEPNVIDWRLNEKERNIVYLKKNHVKAGQAVTQNISSVVFSKFFATRAKGGRECELSDAELRASFSTFEKSDQQWIALATNLLPSALAYARLPQTLGWVKKGLESLGLSNLNEYDFDRLYGIVFRYVFKFSDVIIREIENARTILGLNTQSYIGFHVRTGFVGTLYKIRNHPKLLRDPQLWDRVIDCAHNQSTQRGQDKRVIYLATDSNLIKDRALQKYGNIRSLNNSVMHVDRLKVTPGKVGESEREGLMSLWVEVSLLAEAHSIVMRRSGFSFLASSLCLIPQRRVIDGVTCQALESEE